jgi:hypothetical protein
VQLPQTLDFLHLSALAGSEHRTLSLDAPLGSYTGHHLLLVALQLDAQLDPSLAHFLAVVKQLLRDVDVEQLIGDLGFGVSPQLMLSIEDFGEGDEAGAVDFEVVLVAGLHVEEDEVERSGPQFETVQRGVDIGQGKFFGDFFLPDQVVAGCSVDLQNLFFGISVDDVWDGFLLVSVELVENPAFQAGDAKSPVADLEEV